MTTWGTADAAAGIFGRLFATGKPLMSRKVWSTQSGCHASLTRTTSSTATTGEPLRGNSADCQHRRKFDADGAAKVVQRKPHGACPGGSRDLARRQHQEINNKKLSSEPRPLTRPLKEMSRLTRTALKSVSTTAGFGRGRLEFSLSAAADHRIHRLNHSAGALRSFASVVVPHRRKPPGQAR